LAIGAADVDPGQPGGGVPGADRRAGSPASVGHLRPQPFPIMGVQVHDDEPAAGAQHPGQLRDGAGRVRGMVQVHVGEDGVEGAVRHGANLSPGASCSSTLAKAARFFRPQPASPGLVESMDLGPRAGPAPGS